MIFGIVTGICYRVMSWPVRLARHLEWSVSNRRELSRWTYVALVRSMIPRVTKHKNISIIGQIGGEFLKVHAKVLNRLDSDADTP
jgi:hypothetical protein